MTESPLSLSKSFPNNHNNMEMKINITTVATTLKTRGQTLQQPITTMLLQVSMIEFWMNRLKACWISNTPGKTIRILTLPLKVCTEVGSHRPHHNQEKEYYSSSLDLRLNTSRVVCIVVKIQGELYWTLQGQQWLILFQQYLTGDSVHRMWRIDLRIIWQMLGLLWMLRNLTTRKWLTDLIMDVLNKWLREGIMDRNF